jgi:DNA-binding response OmpR family regulator
MRILLVEDEKKIASFLARSLREEKYAVDIAHDGDKGLALADLNEYDLIVLDIMLPGKDGIYICRELRHKKNDVPVLMLTARDTTYDKVIGLDSGADDYVVKPVALAEFLARVRSLLRRTRVEKKTVLSVADLELDQLSHKVRRAGTDIPVTSKEYALLEYLMLNAHQIVTRTMISEHVWNESFDTFTNVIEVYIRYLRNKIDKGFGTPLLRTVRGTGYMLTDATP